MTSLFFNMFNTITYNGTLTKNITERIALISADTRKSPTAYYPYIVGEGMRADFLSDAYYKDSGFDYLIYLTNGITDPFYDWYMTDADFTSYINKKYGSIPNAQQQVVHYKNNWDTAPYTMSVSAFLAQDQAIQKYYFPVFGEGPNIISYARRQEDWIAVTNQIVNLTFTANAAFLEGENINVISNTGSVVGAGQIIFANSTCIDIQHVSGFNDPQAANTALTAVGITSSASANIVSSTVKQYVISLEEQAYWSPVTAYTIESNRNESQKYIYLLDSAYAAPTAEQIRKKLVGK